MEVTTHYRKKGKKGSHTYERIHVTEFTVDTLTQYIEVNTSKHQSNKRGYTNDIQKDIPVRQYKFGKWSESAMQIYCGFDIETTRIDENKTFMYGWQFGLFNTVIWGDTWVQFIEFLGKLKDILQYKKSHRVIVFVANLGYEWQFIKHYLNVTRSFFKELREPVEIEHDNFFIFKECLSWGHSLAKLAEDYCSLPKLKGDLDYSVYRESYRDFKNEREWAYIDFDVLILTQFSKWFFETYLIKEKYKPVTITQALMHNIKKRQKETGEETPLPSDFPKSYSDYYILMNWVYRGGYVHANADIVGVKTSWLWSYDFTSSYPAVMECEKYPYDFEEVDANMLNTEKLNFDTDNYAFYALFVFKDIESTTSHSIESSSKCIALDRPLLDNGRVKRARNMAVWLTEQDFITYQEFYSWRVCYCLKLYVSKKKQLPRYLLDEMNYLYTQKAILKANKQNYSIEKSYVNTLYGATVKKLIVSEVKLDEELNTAREPKDLLETYNKYTRKNILLPQFGVWVSAYARRNLLSCVYKLETQGYPVYYCDTDSIKFKGYGGKVVIDAYNDKKQKQIAKICEERNLDKSIFWDLGSFDCEYKKGIQQFLTLGAKRYLHQYSEGGKIHRQATIAGVPKKVYIERYGDSEEHFFGSFRDSLVIENCKLSSSYNDNDTFTVERLGMVETVPSCVTLNDCEFSLSIDAEWGKYLYQLVSEGVGEIRII